MKTIQTKARPRRGVVLLRHDRIDAGRSRWSEAHARWLETQAFDSPVPPIVVPESVDAAREATRRVADREDPIRTAAPVGSRAPLVEALISLRGIHILSAVTILAELGDITRFDTPRPGMRVLGRVPSERSSGPRRRTGGITKTGNSHVRRILVEAAWTARVPARTMRHRRAKAAGAPERVQACVGHAPHTRPRGASVPAPTASAPCASITARSPRLWPASLWASSGPLSARSPSGRMPAGPGPERCRSQP